MAGDRACPLCGCRCESEECVCDLAECEHCDAFECLRGSA